MLDHTILTVSDVERALAFYEAALKPLNVRFFLPYKGEHGHPDLWGFQLPTISAPIQTPS
jgi:catechol 2,3-dioxygenase-like lactoylglutathione lyase family enzyme